MDQSYTFDSIWYREKPTRESTRADPFVREQGRLVVGNDELHFEGKKLKLAIRDIEAVEYGVFGTMSNPSVQVRYRDGEEVRHAWFTDGRLGGYWGMFVATRQLAQSLDHLGPTTFDDKKSRGSQYAMLAIIGGLVVVFIRMVFF